MCTTTGRNKMGNITSFALIFIDIVANNIPHNEIPKRAGKEIQSMFRGDSVTLNNTIKIGTSINSITIKNITLDSTLPKKMTSLPTGEASRPWKAPPSVSARSILLNPTMAPNIIETQRIPGTIKLTVFGVDSSAKLNITTTNKEKIKTGRITSLLLISSKKSFLTSTNR
jgi:hypothetical protein